MESRAPRADQKYRLPMLAVGTVPNREDSDADGSGSSFVVMPLCERRLPTIGQLTTPERLSIVERLFLALAELHRHDPCFVHGAIREANVGLCSQTDALVLLDFCLELVLGEPLLPPGVENVLRPEAPRPTAGQSIRVQNSVAILEFVRTFAARFLARDRIT